MAKHCKKQLMNTKLQIRAEFEQLHQFLKREEEGRLAALQEEEEQKTKTITLERKDIRAQISVVSEVISAVKRDLAQEDNAAFLASYELTQTSVRHLCSRPDPQLRPGGLVDVAKHLGNLSFRVWEKMREERIKFTPKIPQRIRVVLDCDRGEVSFYNPEGNDHIYTHEATFSEKIYPYFSVGKQVKLRP
ncbi:hypothetical protein CRUP_003056 [Coryphaenoides rupestris]|nr:hypothetical protein CRUP_003056 [Coryphaenoides rupestris]